MKDKLKIGGYLTIEWLQKIYREYGIVHVATDGAYVQVTTDEIEKDSQGLQSQKSQ